MPCPSDHPANLLLPQGREIDPTDGVKEHEKKSILCRHDRLFGVFLEVGDEVVPLLRLLQTTKGHLGTGDVLLGVLEVLEQSLLVPLNTSARLPNK